MFPFTGGSRFIQNGVLTTTETAVFGAALFGVTFIAGVFLTWSSGPGLFAIGAAGLLIGWAYSAPPIRGKSRPFLDSLINTAYIFPYLIALAWHGAAAEIWVLAE